MATKFAQRLFTAQMKREDDLLNQVENDIEIAKEDGIIDTEEYLITASDNGDIMLFDKVNNEITDISEIGDEYIMTDHFDDSTNEEGSDELITSDVSDEDEIANYNLLTTLNKFYSSSNKGLVVLRVGDYDVGINTEKKTARILDEEYSEEFKVNLNLPMKTLLSYLQNQIDSITSSKNFSKYKYNSVKRVDPRNFSRLSPNVRKYLLNNLK
jgi:hypothetical protein